MAPAPAPASETTYTGCLYIPADATVGSATIQVTAVAANYIECIDVTVAAGTAGANQCLVPSTTPGPTNANNNNNDQVNNSGSVLGASSALSAFVFAIGMTLYLAMH